MPEAAKREKPFISRVNACSIGAFWLWVKAAALDTDKTKDPFAEYPTKGSVKALESSVFLFSMLIA